MKAKQKVKDIGFDEWYDLYIKFEQSDMNDPEVRKTFNREFTELSAEYWAMWLTSEDETPQSLGKALSSLWFECDAIPSVVEAYETALARLWYSSDRMNFDRWLHIRWLLNLDIH